METGTLAKGRVVRLQGNNYDVEIQGEMYRCRIAGKLKKDRRGSLKPAAVGDRVEVLVAEENEGRIESVGDRSSWLSRADVGRGNREQVIVSNVDRVFAVQAVKEPNLDPHLIDRSIVMALAGEMEPYIVVNKIDLVDEDIVTELRTLYEGLGYSFLATSAETGEGVDALRDAMTEKTSVFFGPSGVGKSSLLNKVQEGLGLKVGLVRERSRKGRHTTTWVELIPLEFGGYTCDTPGIEYFTLWGVESVDLHLYFKEFGPYAGECRFNDCLHNSEPGCAVKAAVESGVIDRRRYESFLKILDSLENPRYEEGYQ